MYIIKIEASENGARPPLQSWASPNQPDGFAFCDEAAKDVFYSTTPAGFVDISIKEIDGYKWVDSIEVNQAAVDKWNEEHPVTPEPDPEPTQMEKIEAQVTYTAMMTDTLITEV